MQQPQEPEVAFINNPEPSEYVHVYLIFGKAMDGVKGGMDLVGCETSWDSFKKRMDKLANKGHYIEFEARNFAVRRPVSSGMSPLAYLLDKMEDEEE